jgi:16S rRNA (guanine966-N2)-methyltransferase
MTNQVRIIAGKWRGKLISFPTEEGLRPSLDRIRETCFNWLQGYLPGSYCLDAFAGSGIFGLEALSRGAAHCTFIEAHPKIFFSIEKHCQSIAPDQTHCLQATIPFHFIPKNQFNLVFLDPPFHQNLLLQTLHWLIDNNLLAPDALIYLETEKSFSFDDLPSNYEVMKEKTTKSLRYGLIKEQGNR